MRRHLFIFASDVSLLLFAATVGLWIITETRELTLRCQWTGKRLQDSDEIQVDHAIRAVANNGSVALIYNGGDLPSPIDPNVPGRFKVRTGDFRLHLEIGKSERCSWRQMIFGRWHHWHRVVRLGEEDQFVSETTIPLWAVAAMLSVLPACQRFRRFLGSSETSSHCACGYDLTDNTSGICPECGKAVRQKSEASP